MGNRGYICVAPRDTIHLHRGVLGNHFLTERLQKESKTTPYEAHLGLNNS